MEPNFIFVCLTLVLFLCAWAEDDAQTVLNAKVGGAVTLRTGLCAEKQILWTFGLEEPNERIIKVNLSLDQVFSARLRTRVYVEPESGGLTIYNLTLSDAGVYLQQCIGTFISARRFKLNVYNEVTRPSLRVADRCSNPLTVECFVNNSRDLSLSWFKGQTRLKNISGLNLPRLSLSVKVEHGDTSSFTCEAQNPVDRKWTQLNLSEMSLKNGESSCWCHSEQTVRLVLSAVVGLILSVLVVDHLRIRK